MQVFAAVEADLIGLFLIFVMAFYGKIQERDWRERKTFKYLLISNVVLCVTDMAGWLLEGMMFRGAYVLLHVSTFLYNVSLVCIGFFWLVYCDNQTMENRKNAKKRKLFYALPFFIILIFNSLNVKTGWIFYYDEYNVYHRGELYSIHIMTAILYLVMAVSMVLMAANGQTKSKAKETYGLLGFVVTPAITFIVQAMFYGVSLIPFGISLSLLMIFLQRIIAMITKDHLTGLDNFRAFERKLDERIRDISEREKLFVMMIDANYFKTINDTYGHDAGDEALVKIADAMRYAGGSGDYLARLGGDEFVIIGSRKEETDIGDLVERLHSKLKEESEKAKYTLSVSVGYEIYQYRKHRNGVDLYKNADEKMYENKRKFHSDTKQD